MPNKRVTCVIPTIGRASLASAVASVARQTVPTSVVVVLDRPDEEEAVKQLLRTHDYNLITTKGSEGGNVARNLGVDAATTDYVAFLDDDDWWEPEKVATQLAAIGNPDASRSAFSASSFWFHRGSHVSRVPKQSPSSHEDSASYLTRRDRLYFGGNAIQTSSLLMSRELAIATRWDQSLRKHQDWDFIARALRSPSTDLVWVDRPLVNVVQGSAGSISRRSDWGESAAWLERHERYMSTRSAADFVATQVFRAALKSRDREGVMSAAALLRKYGRPHVAAAVVGLSGIRG